MLETATSLVGACMVNTTVETMSAPSSNPYHSMSKSHETCAVFSPSSPACGVIFTVPLLPAGSPLPWGSAAAGSDTAPQPTSVSAAATASPRPMLSDRD